LINSRQKGKRGELEFKDFLLARGIEARRGVQHRGGSESPDVISSLTGVHWEVKRVERGNPYDWLAQAIGDAGSNLPIVAHRRSNEDWIAVLRLDDLVRLLQASVVHGPAEKI